MDWQRVRLVLGFMLKIRVRVRVRIRIKIKVRVSSSILPYHQCALHRSVRQSTFYLLFAAQVMP